jgi:hypothetical protein
MHETLPPLVYIHVQPIHRGSSIVENHWSNAESASTININSNENYLSVFS